MGKEKIVFDDDDLKGTMRPHDNALVVTLRTGRFLVADTAFCTPYDSSPLSPLMVKL